MRVVTASFISGGTSGVEGSRLGQETSCVSIAPAFLYRLRLVVELATTFLRTVKVADLLATFNMALRIVSLTLLISCVVALDRGSPRAIVVVLATSITLQVNLTALD